MIAQGLKSIFNCDDEGSRDTHNRLAERHIHRDRLVPDELDSFWGSVAYGAPKFLSPELWKSVAPGRMLC